MRNFFKAILLLALGGTAASAYTKVTSSEYQVTVSGTVIRVTEWVSPQNPSLVCSAFTDFYSSDSTFLSPVTCVSTK